MEGGLYFGKRVYKKNFSNARYWRDGSCTLDRAVYLDWQNNRLATINRNGE